jgi:hypothetical protein
MPCPARFACGLTHRWNFPPRHPLIRPRSRSSAEKETANPTSFGDLSSRKGGHRNHQKKLNKKNNLWIEEI